MKKVPYPYGGVTCDECKDSVLLVDGFVHCPPCQEDYCFHCSYRRFKNTKDGKIRIQKEKEEEIQRKKESGELYKEDFFSLPKFTEFEEFFGENPEAMYAKRSLLDCFK